MVAVSENRPKGRAPRGVALELPLLPTPQRTVATVRRKPYKDSLAKTATPKKATCGSYAIVCECSSGQHHFAKKLVCGREWCEVCGAENSAAHKRRQARILPKLQQISQLGYFVIEFPNFYRHIGRRGLYADQDNNQYIAGWCYSKADLQDTTKTIINVLAGTRCGRKGRINSFYRRGLGRWHWYGDKKQGKYNPHFNVLVDGANLAPEQLEKIKDALRISLNVPDLIVHYSYFNQPGQFVQKARYLTRATFLNEDWDQYMVSELYDFRNMRWWGKWKDAPAWELNQAEAQGQDTSGLTEVSELQTGVCPDCGQPLKVLYHKHKSGASFPVCWSRPIDSTYLLVWSAREIAGTGYYRIPHREWSEYRSSPATLLRKRPLDDLTTSEKMRLWLIRQERRGEPIQAPSIHLIKLSRVDRQYLGIPLDDSAE